jgi:sigma-B regulation protein RsbU (phosphoserine phosphatase)
LRSASRIDALAGLLIDFTYARLGKGIPATPAPMDAYAVAERVVDELRASNPGREIRIESAQPAIHGHWDGDRVSQLISNLVSNALQYGAAGRPITVSLSSHSEASLEVRVHNHGPAMPAEIRQHLFEPYRRGKGAESSHPRGLGLGLFIVREIARTLMVRLPGRHPPLPRASGSATLAQATAAELPAS